MNKRVTTQARQARSSERFRQEGLSLGCRVRGLRNERGWTLEEAGHRMSMDPKHLWKLERAYDGLNVTLVTLVRIADAFEVPVQSLFAFRGKVCAVEGRRKKAKALKRDLFSFCDAPAPEERYQSCLPLFKFEEIGSSVGQICELRAESWICPEGEAEESLSFDRGDFVAQLDQLPKGHPMAKRYAIFQSPARSLSGAPLLLSHPDWSTPRARLFYYQPRRIVGPTGLLENSGACLTPLSLEEPTIELDANEQRHLHFVASMRRVLISDPPHLDQLIF